MPAPTHEVARRAGAAGSSSTTDLDALDVHAARARLARGARLRVPRRARRSCAAATASFSVSDGVTVALLRLDGGTLTVFARPASAAATIAADPRAARPAVALEGTLLGATEPWTPQARPARRATATRPSSSSRSRTTAPRRCASATACTGAGPRSDTSFEATYRVGNGTAGNVGAGAIAHVVDARTARSSARRTRCRRGRRRPRAGRRGPARRAGGVPRPAARGHATTTTRASASATRTCSARRRRSAGRARGTPSSSPPTASAGSPVDDAFETELRRHLEPFRMAGYDLEVDGPRFVPLDVALHVCVAAGVLPRAREGRRARRALERRARRRHARLLPPRPLHVRRAGLPVGDRRGGAGACPASSR